jgi:uncharacterized protein with FMN-binding domain
MKRIVKILTITLLIFVVIIAGGFLYIKNMELPEISIGEVQLGNIANGAYIGDYSAGLVSATVTVTVKDKKIQGITINKHENGLGKKAERIVNEIVEKQSLNVDNVSGATLSSGVIRKAVEQALVKQSVVTNQ